MSLTLVDTSVWIEHLRSPQEELIALLRERRALIHSAVIGELACGNLPKRAQLISDLQLLPRALEATGEETLKLIEDRKMYGRGLGWIDAILVASALLSGATLLSYDKRLASLFASL